MEKLKGISVLFCAKLQATLMALIGLVAGAIYSLGGLSWELATRTPLNLGTLMAFASLVGMPLLFAIVGFATGIVSAFLYNSSTRWIPRIGINLERDFIVSSRKNTSR